MLVHFTGQKKRSAILPPGASKLRCAFVAFTCQQAIVKHKAKGLIFGGIAGGIPASPGIHEQRTPFKPATIGSENEIHISVDVTILKVFSSFGMERFIYRGNAFRPTDSRRYVPLHQGHHGPAEQRILRGDQAAFPIFSPVPRRIQSHFAWLG